MNIFVLCTGRCGSVTFSKACEHLSNYTTGHESKYRHFADERLAFPDRHIEVDFRLTWYLGPLENLYGKKAFYVHLTRSPELVAGSYVNKFDRHGQGMGGFWVGMLGKPRADLDLTMLDMIGVMNENIKHYLRDKEHMCIDIDAAVRQFPEFCERIGAQGDIKAACSEFRKRYNAGLTADAAITATS